MNDRCTWGLYHLNRVLSPPHAPWDVNRWVVWMQIHHCFDVTVHALAFFAS